MSSTGDEMSRVNHDIESASSIIVKRLLAFKLWYLRMTSFEKSVVTPMLANLQTYQHQSTSGTQTSRMTSMDAFELVYGLSYGQIGSCMSTGPRAPSGT